VRSHVSCMGHEHVTIKLQKMSCSESCKLIIIEMFLLPLCSVLSVCNRIPLFLFFRMLLTLSMHLTLFPWPHIFYDYFYENLLYCKNAHIVYTAGLHDRRTISYNLILTFICRIGQEPVYWNRYSDWASNVFNIN